MSRACRTIALVIVAACSGKPEQPPAAAPPPPPPPVDAAVESATAIGGHDPQSGMHLDDGVPRAPARSAAKRANRTIEVMLRSTPSGATVHVDGSPIGTTPTMWSGESGEHEFTFVLPRHALARYRFHAIASGIVHARLDPVADERDLGVPPPEVVRPQIVPPIVAPPAPAPSIDQSPVLSVPTGPQP